MNRDLLIMALCVGAATWAFRFLPTRLNLTNMAPDSLLSRFLAATGPAAIATLFVASVVPMAMGGALPVPLAVGTGAVVGVFLWRRSVVAATLAGAAAYGGVFALMG